jgi:hypothetical protein
MHLLRLLPALQQLLQSLGLGVPGTATGSVGRVGAGGGAGGQSSIRTRYLAMTLDHETGRMDGSVREGPFEGRRLSALSLDQLLRMLELYEDSDPRSAAVLTAYLDRAHGEDWRDAAAAGAGAADGGRESGAVGHSAMSKADALQVLGLEPGAAPDQIRAAHRRLMQKLHPDRGGSDYLAAQINAAKTLLLGE